MSVRSSTKNWALLPGTRFNVTSLSTSEFPLPNPPKFGSISETLSALVAELNYKSLFINSCHSIIGDIV